MLVCLLACVSPDEEPPENRTGWLQGDRRQDSAEEGDADGDTDSAVDTSPPSPRDCTAAGGGVCGWISGTHPGGLATVNLSYP